MEKVRPGNGMSRVIIFLLFFLLSVPSLWAQFKTIEKQIINSDFLKEDRELIICLPEGYTKNDKYPVIYVLDAEFHFDLLSSIVGNLSKMKKMPEHIIVGIPHISTKKERVRDFTFSLSEVNPYGDKVLPSFFNEKNCGFAHNFLRFLTEEVVTCVDSNYSTNKKNVLFAHSLGAYFVSVLLITDHPFYAVQLYDPSNWYSNGEASRMINKGEINPKLEYLYLGHQKSPKFHHHMLQQLHMVFEGKNLSNYKRVSFEDENHGSVFLAALLDGMDFLFQDYKKENFRITKKRPYKR